MEPASQPTPGPDGPPRAFAVSECQDRLAMESRALRRHFWRRLLPCVGITSYMVVSLAVGLGLPAAVMVAVFGALTAREALRFRDNLGSVRALEDELTSLREGDT